MFQLWSHRVFPSLLFRDFIETAEKQCRTARVKVSCYSVPVFLSKILTESLHFPFEGMA
jgi:hypothetical protein